MRAGPGESNGYRHKDAHSQGTEREPGAAERTLQAGDSVFDA
jgi:hypothetical protein